MNNADIAAVQQTIKRMHDSGALHAHYCATLPYIIVSVSQQRLYLLHSSAVMFSYRISTALNGTGSQEGSGQTPLGFHRVADKIGADALSGSIFKARHNTQQIARVLTVANEYSDHDCITSRILWLDGLEVGKNKGGDVDTHSRYIYIHGTNEEWRLGQAVSHGCIRMANKDVIQLFNKIVVDSLVVIIK